MIQHRDDIGRICKNKVASACSSCVACFGICFRHLSARAVIDGDEWGHPGLLERRLWAQRLPKLERTLAASPKQSIPSQLADGGDMW